MGDMRCTILLLALLLGACASQPQNSGSPINGEFNPIEAAKTRISLGLTYLKNGNYSQAKFNLDKALQFAPRFADAHYSIAYYYQVVGELERAEASYKEALARAPRNADIANTYGAFLCQQGKYEEAKGYFLKAVNSQNYVSTAETYENLALCSQSQGQTDDAITYLQNALNHQPSRSKTMLLLAQFYAADQQYINAKDMLRKYERVSRVTPETLWLSFQIEKALENWNLAQGYGDMLIQMYPNHPNTQAYIAQRVSQNRKPVVKEIFPTREKNVSVPEKPERPVVSNVVDTPQRPEDSPTEAVVPAANPDAGALEEQRIEEPATVADDGASAVSEPQQAPANTSVESRQDVALEADETPIDEPQVTDSVGERSGADTDISSRYHIVQKNENLYRISLQYNIRMQRLIEWNQLEDASSIYAGKKLLIVDPETIE